MLVNELQSVFSYVVNGEGSLFSGVGQLWIAFSGWARHFSEHIAVTFIRQLGTAVILCGWTVQGYSAVAGTAETICGHGTYFVVGPGRDTLLWGTAVVLHCHFLDLLRLGRDTSQLGIAGILCG